jgi:hypothetical protein
VYLCVLCGEDFVNHRATTESRPPWYMSQRVSDTPGKIV